MAPVVKVAIVGASGETGQSIVNGLLGASETKFVCDILLLIQAHTPQLKFLTYYRRSRRLLGQSL